MKKIPHKWAEVIKAWADGETVQCRAGNSTYVWKDTETPSWEHLGLEFRVKPPHSYPLTRMTSAQLVEAYCTAAPCGASDGKKLEAVASAAIRRAIDDGDVVEVPLHERKPL